MKRLLYFLVLLAFITIIMPLLAPNDPMSINLEDQNHAPAAEYLLGTDALGRDVFSRLLVGGRQTILVAAGATAITMFVGTLLGMSAGFFAGRLDTVVSIMTDALLAFPGLILALSISVLFDPGLGAITLAVGVSQIAPFIRVARSAAINERGRGYISGAYAIGATRQRVLWSHILPNAAPTLLAFTGVTFGYCILNATALGFLGLGGEPGIPEWGTMLSEGRLVLRIAPWASIAPGLAISLTVYLVMQLMNPPRRDE